MLLDIGTKEWFMRKIHNDGKIHIGKDYNIKAAPGFDLKEELYGTYLEILRDGKSERNSFLSKLLNKDFQALQTKDTESGCQCTRTYLRLCFICDLYDAGRYDCRFLFPELG